METLRQQIAVRGIFKAIEQLPHDAEARRRDAAVAARMNAFVEHMDFEIAGDEAAQRSGQPQLIVIAGARIEAYDEPHFAKPLAQRVDIRQQIVAARLLAGFDQADAARTFDALRVERGERA